jgi:hypothetical protein
LDDPSPNRNRAQSLRGAEIGEVRLAQAARAMGGVTHQGPAMLTTSATYRLITRDIDRSLAETAARPRVALESDYYLKHIGAVTSIDDFLKDTRLFTFAMKAFGLEDMAYARGFVRKILSDGVSDPQSLANRLTDDRFVAFARTFDFAAKGENATASTDAQQGVVDRYVRQTLEVSAGENNEGVRLALYFQREAPSVTSAYTLLSDAALWQVVKTVFGFPDEMANADIEKQANAVLQRLDLVDLKDPAKLDRLIARFTATWDATQTSAQDPVLSLFSTQAQPSVDLDLIMTLKSLKYGGS